MTSGPSVAVLGALTLLLVGCASPVELRAHDEAACQSYGFQPNTPDFAACLQREALARQYATGPRFGLGLGFGFGHAW